jgi:integrase
MPAEQRGYVYETKTGYGIRWRDAAGTQHRRSGFETKRDARKWLRDHLDAGLRIDRLTFAELAERYLEAHAVGREASTLYTLRERLRRPVAIFGDLDLQDLERRASEIAAWQATLPTGSRHGISQAFRQTLEAGVRWGYLRQNPAKLAGPNPQPKPAEVKPFTLDEIDRIATELGPLYGPLVVLASETGLRPSESCALERADVSRAEGIVTVARTYSLGVLKGYGKTSRSRRRVPLSARAEAALDAVAPRLDSRLPFPAARGGHINLHYWRSREWRPALVAAGVTMRRIYDLRHTAISHWLAAGLGSFEVARFMGTSVRMVDLTYGHLVSGSELEARRRLNEWAKSVPRSKTGDG